MHAGVLTAVLGAIGCGGQGSDEGVASSVGGPDGSDGGTDPFNLALVE